MTATKHACRIMKTRACPQSYNAPCGERTCARFESDDETPWTAQHVMGALRRRGSRTRRNCSTLNLMDAVTPRITRDDLLARWAQADQADPAVIEAAKQRARTIIDSGRNPAQP